MPVRSLSSAVFKWPDRDSVLAAARSWAASLKQSDPAVEQVWCVGSYARGDWGVGSDVDLIVVLKSSDLTPAERYRRYYPDALPISADLWVHTVSELQGLQARASAFWQRILSEKIVLVGSD